MSAVAGERSDELRRQRVPRAVAGVWRPEPGREADVVSRPGWVRVVALQLAGSAAALGAVALVIQVEGRGEEQVWDAVVPALVVALAVLAVAQAPLVWWLARRTREEQAARAELACRADEAAADERDRIAAELHDGVVQDLAGAAYELSATEARLDRLDDEQVAAALRRGASVARTSIGALRELLVDLTPPLAPSADLAVALEELVEPLRARGLEVTLDAARDGDADADRDQLVYRAAREALRNVERHAAATRVTVALRADERAVRLVVADDGRGMTAADVAEQRAAGHVGLTLLAHRVVALDGRLAIASEPGRGTRVTLELGALT